MSYLSQRPLREVAPTFRPSFDSLGKMLESLKKRWKELKRSEPGRRFQEQYERGAKKGANPAKKPVLMVLGILLVLVGLFFMVVPGPGIPVLLMGAVLIAGQSLVMARFLDWLELKLRPAFLKTMAWARHWMAEIKGRKIPRRT